MKPGRNDPCSCGSGKKYKHCCLRVENAVVETPEEFLRRRLRAVIGDLAERLLRFIGRQFEPGLIQEAWEDFTGETEPFDPKTPHIVVFMPWFFHHWYPSRANTRFPDLAARKVTVASELILHQRPRLDPLLVRYLEACAAAAFSFHEAVRVEPGRGFLLRDLMLESETFVVEHSASRSVHPGDIVFAQIVRIDGLAMLEGCGPVAFQPLEKPAIIDLRKTVRGRGDVVGEARLKERSLELIDLYLELAERKLHPVMPTLQNTDGEPVEPHTLGFRGDNSDAAAASLDAAQLAGGEEIVQDEARRGQAGKLIEAGWTWRRAGNAMHSSWDNTTLGQIALAGRQLKVNVNSAARAVRARALVERLLEGNARYRATEITSAEAMLAEARNLPAHQDDSEHQRLMQMPEVRQQLAEM
ncbi:MAG: SEC-C metal-binding domain-containing protein, partial [Pseudomonadota bacterium]